MLKRQLLNHRWWVLLLGAALIAGSYFPVATELEHRLYSRLLALLPASPAPQNTVVVDLDTDAEPYPYLRLAALLDRLAAAGPRALGLALPLDHSQSPLDPQARARLQQWLATQSPAPDGPALMAALDPDARLAEALQAAGPVVLAAPQGRPGPAATRWPALPRLATDAPGNLLTTIWPLLRPPRVAQAAPRVPLARFIHDAPVGLLTTATNAAPAAASLATGPDGTTPGFELALAAAALRVPLAEIRVHPGQGLDLGTARYATDAALAVYPRPLPDDARLPVLRASELLAGSVDAGKRLRGKTVLLGSLAGPLGTPVRFPGGRVASQLQWKAYVVDALIGESFVSVPYWALGAQRGALLLVLIYLLLLPFKLRGRVGLVIGGVLALLLLNGNLLLLLLQNTWLPLALPVMLLAAGQGLLYVHHGIGQRFTRLREQRDGALVALAANLRAQGLLDKAIEQLDACAPSGPVKEELYQLGLEYERRRQFAKALSVYRRIAGWDKGYRDIEQRLARHQSGSEPVSLAATSISHAATALVVDDPTVERPVLGRYQVERELGRGAMGTVYLGRDPRIGRTVAIKTLPLSEEFESEQLAEVRRRFFQEAETAGRLSHPNIVTIYDVGEEHDLAYIAMDYIVGVSLEEHVHKDDLLPLEDVFGIGVQVAEALDYAHRQKVVHRDVKPGNIIYDAERGQLKVTDFGIACLTDSSKTRTGTVLGSPYYMSPEQIAGKRVDGRSDLFSLGVTLYQLFSGRLPFEGDSVTNLLYRITQEKPRGVRKVRADLPTCLTRFINRALEKDPDKRFADGQAMSDALKRCAEQAGIAYRKGRPGSPAV